MEAVLVSTGVVAIAEIGDKTQLLALMLAAWLGALVAGWLGPDVMRWVLGISFLAMAGWALIPDKADEEPKMLAKATACLTCICGRWGRGIGEPSSPW